MYYKLGRIKHSIKMIIGIFGLVIAVGCMTIVTSGFVNAYRIVTINDGGMQYNYTTLKQNVDEMLKGKSIELKDGDETEIKDDGHLMVIDITRAVPIKVTADGIEKCLTLSPKATVSDAINKADITLGGQDMVNVLQTSNVYKDLNIVISRVNTQDRADVLPLAKGSEERKSSDLFIGQNKFLGGGEDGEITHYYRDTLVEGAVTQTVETGSLITKEPKNDIILVGTKARVSQRPALSKGISSLPLPSWVQLDANGIPVNYQNVKSGRATAYTGGGTTSTGKTARTGYVAVNPKVIPYGTQMYIVSQNGYVYGYAIASDTGGALLSGNALVDLYMDTTQQCINFGARTVNIYIL